MEVSQIVEQWEAEARMQARAEGRAEGQQATLVRILNSRFPQQIPPELVRRVAAETNTDTLNQWVDLSVAGTFEQVREAILAPRAPGD